jgi:hypothetical protein
MKNEKQESRWYCLDFDGLATLCADEDDAKKTAEWADKRFPRNGPHRAVQLVEKEKHE